MVLATTQLTKFQNLKISKNFDQYAQAINNLTKDNVKEAISILVANNDNEELFKLLLSSLINQIVSFLNGTGGLSEFIPAILSSLKCLQNPISLLFQLLESLSQKRDEVARLKVLEVLARFEFGVVNIVNMLYKADSDQVICDLLKLKDRMVDDFIRQAIKIDHPTVAKNLSLVLPILDPNLFVNYNSFLFLFESESHHLRNCLLDIFQVLVRNYKERENVEAIREITLLISERLCDVNFYVRSRALGVISELFKNECILKDQRNALIREIMGRVKDKTVIVRKKSVNLLSQILLNHPFRDREDLSRVEDVNIGDRRMLEDFNDFVDLMESSLSLITSLLDCNLKTDLSEISGFIKISYLLKLRGSRETLQKMLGLIFTKDREIVIDVFKEILTKRGEVLYEFINDRAFEAILSYLEINEKHIYKNVFDGHRVFEGLYVLRWAQRSISGANALDILRYTTDILFKSKDEDSLKMNIETYINMLCILKKMKHRIDCFGDILTLCIKNAIKMVFFERSVIKHTVELIYFTSNNPDATAGKFLKSLCLTKSNLKLVDAVGWVALNHFYLLERLEQTFRSDKGGDRLSLVRKSLEGKGIDENTREKRKSLEEMRRASLSGMPKPTASSSERRLSLRFEELEESLRSRTDEEIADFFFYLKEKEILYSSHSMLSQFVPLLIDSLTSQNSEIQATAHLSLFKCMLVSSEFFNEHRPFLFSAMHSPNVAVRNSAISAFHDLLIFYNTSLDPSDLFEKLNDREVCLNAMLAIFNLLHKNIIRLKNNAVRLVSLLFDEDLGPIVKTLIKNLSSNSNAISVIFYETFTSNLGIEYVRCLTPFISSTIHESLFLKCLNTSTDQERLKCVYEGFEIGDKFINENMFRKEMKGIIESG